MDKDIDATWDKDGELLANYCLNEWLILPEYPIMYGYFQFVYLNNRSINEFKINIVPNFICFDARRCPVLLSRIVPIKIIDSLTCCRSSDLIEASPRKYFPMFYEFRNLYHECSTTGNETSCADSSYFHCYKSLKCISYNRVGDGFNDCYHNEDELFPTCHLNISNRFNCVNQTKTCFCPPNYFDSQCQWQSQRVSLTLQFRTQSITVSPIIFQFIIMLIDEQGNIASNYEQITYMPAHDCNRKFNIYLLYPHRPKYSSRNDSIRIDLFDKLTLDYWTSWYLPIPFQFLPVNRISAQLNITEVRENKLCALSCGEHGQCMRYTNMNNSVFCRCDQGYSGIFCNITYQCQCSNDSFCLAPSICVCPLNKFGSHCYLKRSICQSVNNPCQHNGLCIAIDVRINLHEFICICKEGYQGERCQYKSNQIDIRIDETIVAISSSFILHYITVFDKYKNYERMTTLKKIAFGYNTMTIYVQQPFNMIFIQIPDGDYYLIVLREKFIPSEYIHTQVLPKNRCYPVLHLFNDTFRQFEHLRLVKYYPLLCRQNLELMCFYDEYYMCVCDSDRYSNCFQFKHTMKNDCSGKNLCYNNGRCFRNNETCPTTFMCVCNDCYYGRQCQFSTKDFIFSLDPILGYHIKPNASFHQQPFIVIFSIIITTIMLISQLIMDSLSIATFKLKNSREVGCGYYLLASSITSMCMIIVLIIKFWQLILSQMSIITNRSILSINCKSIEIILKSGLTSTEWLNACVSIERMFNIMSGISFNKTASRIIAKRVIFIVIILTLITHIHDPIKRQLIDDLDGDQQRIWCLSQYSSTLTIYNKFITLFHFLMPFSINMISAFITIIVAARSRAKVKSKQAFMEHFRLKLKQNKHIIIAPSVLLLLSLPRLIISFTSGCMRSPSQSWQYLIGYFLSFIPSVLILFLFILPSEAWGQHVEYDKINVIFHIPNEDEVDFACEFVETFMYLELRILKENRTKMSNDERLRSLTIIHPIVVGYLRMVPRIESEEIKNLVPTIAPYDSNVQAQYSLYAKEPKFKENLRMRLLIDIGDSIDYLIAYHSDDASSINLYSLSSMYYDIFEQYINRLSNNLNVIKYLYKNKLCGAQQHLRFIVVRRIVIQIELFALNNFRTLTQIDQQVIFKLSLHRYSEVSLTSNNFFILILDRIIELFNKSDEVDHYEIKGCLYILLGNESFFLPTKHSWEILEKL
ncbi:unnamed protein product [Rotaria sordida]|uniref:EGF-like domain-containing protein n=1 Tax=Rotaria sordida TaxID=392033 RepID=A0A816BW86_9BILA|nr:unnamed protein product [Rotaria sordida]CAF1615614.1 unnamed protein product [Rotaria sordida]